MSFCHSSLCLRHGWVKLCAEQLCGFCTSCSPIVCGKLPLQLVLFQFDMLPLYLYIIIHLKEKNVQLHNHKTKVQSLPQQNYTHLRMEKTVCTEQKKIAIC